MTDPVTITSIILFLSAILHFTYQNYRKRKFYEMKMTVLVKVKNQDYDYWSKAIFIIFMSVWYGIRQYKQNSSYSSYLMVALIFLFGINLFIEARKPFEICDNGIFFPDRYVEWNDIVGIEWESMFNGAFEKLIITSKRRPPFLVMKEYNLRIKIPIAQKDNINKIIEKKAKSIV